VGGAVSGNTTAWAYYTPFARRINGLFHHAAAEWISGIAGFLGLLVLPGLVSGIARRRPFLWGLLPLLLFLVAIDLEDGVENGPRSVAKEIWVSLAVLGGAWLISSGPVSLFRWLRVRARHRQEAAQAALQAQRAAASVPQERVWPPPPDYRA
jgi:hypothetical protein